MSRMSLSTPCPPPISSTGLPRRRSSILAVNAPQDDTVTTNLDYTRLSYHQEAPIQPRRRSYYPRRPERQAPVTIFEDVVEDQELSVDPQARNIGGSTLLGRPAQKMPMRRASRLPKDPHVSKASSMPRKRETILPDALFYESIAEEQKSQPTNCDVSDVPAGIIKKEPRRRTIFVPEDTTIMSIHPGADNTSRLNDTFQFPPALEGRHFGTLEIPYERQSRPRPRQLQVPSSVASIVTESREKLGTVPKRSRLSLAAAPPKRIPLSHLANIKSNSMPLDHHGENGGKENIAPNIKQPKGDFSLSKLSPPAPTSVRSRLEKPTAASMARRSIVARNSVPTLSCNSRATSTAPPGKAGEDSSCVKVSPIANDSSNFSRAERRSVNFSKGVQRRSNSSPVSSTDENQRLVPKRVQGDVSRYSRLSQYPVLAEHVSQPQLYEDNWLGHQEVALTELINTVFTMADTSAKQDLRTPKSVRSRMLELYHQPRVTTLHKRLQASLLYGAFTRPKISTANSGPAYDLGLRRQFLCLWLDNYTTNALQIAAEVVVGRQIVTSETDLRGHDLDTSEKILDSARTRRKLIGFLETFLVTVDDISNGDEDLTGDLAEFRWRKTMLRSLMLIWLLDRSKETEIIQGRLFRPDATKKSSAVILLSLGSLLLPSLGDMLRVLRGFEYVVSHSQDLLDEVDYRVENLAIDLRDGILLTRLVELLLFSCSRRNSHGPSKDGGEFTITIQMPDATILESHIDHQDKPSRTRILSQHVKMPCLGRAQKLHNVEVALGALRSYSGPARQAVEDVIAEDIVDGHREKTIILLWSLMSTHGLAELVDWRELQADIKRNNFKAAILYTETPTQTEREALLRTWAGSYYARQGLTVSNLTTSFADGSVYTSILHAFGHFFDAKDPHAICVPSNLPKKLGIEARLQALGCSGAFIKQLVASCGQIPTETTTISNLAFLASRLLPLARRHHASVIIQRSWRLRNKRVELFQRLTLLRIAHACATVVQTQQRLIRSAIVIQRAWRGLVGHRRKVLDDKFVSFQCHARGWLARKSKMPSGHQRVIGGW